MVVEDWLTEILSKLEDAEGIINSRMTVTSENLIASSYDFMGDQDLRWSFRGTMFSGGHARNMEIITISAKSKKKKAVEWEIPIIPRPKRVRKEAITETACKKQRKPHKSDLQTL